MMNAQYLSLFLQDTRDNLAAIETVLVQCDKHQPTQEQLADIMRRAHSCKGAAATMGFSGTAELCHALEDVFDSVRKGERLMDPVGVEMSLRSLDVLRVSLSLIESEQKEASDFSLTEGLRRYLKGEQNIPHSSPEQEDHADIGADLGHIRVDAKKLDSLLELTGELSTLQLQLQNCIRGKEDCISMQPLLDRYGRLLDELSFHVSQSRLVRIDSAFIRFPRLVRDLAHAQGKNVNFTMTGLGVELDKTLVDHLVSPLIHLLRNAVDHGVEAPEERKAAGKPEEAVVRLDLQRMPGYAVVTVEDDGRPIDIQEIRKTARERGFSAADVAAITEDNVMDILCSSHFSTTKTITDVSGRGVGLSAVRAAARSVGGRLDLERLPNGKRFRLSLPLELSVIRAILVQASGNTYAMPFVHTKRLLRIGRNDIRSSLGQQAIVVDGEEVPVLFLRKVFNLAEEPEASPDQEINVVLVEHVSGKVGVGVDTVLRNEDIMVKPVSSVVKDVQYFSGSSVLGDGSIALILDVPSIVQRQKTPSASSLPQSV